MYLRNIKETNVAGAERVRGEWWEIKSQRKQSGAMKGLSHKVRWEAAGRLIIASSESSFISSLG